MKKIAVIGLGYVGLPLAIEFGKLREVVGFDINEKRISELKRCEDLTLEIERGEFEASKYLKYTANPQDLSGCEIFIITVPTPVNSTNRPDLKPLETATSTVGKVIKQGAIVIYESTVYPGCTEEICVPLLEKESSLIYNKEFFCGYSPERINPGDKINTLRKIKKITSGSTEKIADEIDELYLSIIEAGTWKATSIKVAEAAKVIENSQRDMNIAFMNELSIIFNKLGIDTSEVLDAASTKWNFQKFKPGLVGGHCIGVDPYYLTHKSEEVGYLPKIILAGRRINDDMGIYVAHKVIEEMVKNGINLAISKVGVLGVTFKENCTDIRNSRVFDIVNELRKWNIDVVVTDPWASSEEVKNKYNLELTEINETNKVDSLIVAVAHEQYKEIGLGVLKKYCRSEKPVLADLKSIYDKKEITANGFSLFRL